MSLPTAKLSGDPIDLQGLSILGDRQHLAGKIGQHKVQHVIPVYDPGREEALLRSFCAGAEERGMVGTSAGKVLERLFLASRQVQEKIFQTLTAQHVPPALNGDEEFANLRASMSAMNVKLLDYLQLRATMVAAHQTEGIFTKEQWMHVATIQPYNLEPKLADDLFDLISHVTLKHS